MHSGPSKIAEAIISLLVPPACREEIVGDLHERYQSPLQYASEALQTVPLVIFSRIYRTTDPQVLLIQSCALYLSFLGAAWFRDGALLTEHRGLLRLAIPVAMAILGLILDDAYANPRQRSPLNVARAPLLGIILALASQEILQISKSELAIPRWILFYGCAAGLLLSSGLRIIFPPITGQFLGANAPALWLKQTGRAPGKSAAFIMVVVLLLLAYQIYRRA